MNKICKSLFLYIGILVGMSMLFVCLMWCVYLIPVEKIKPNVMQSVYQVPTYLFSDVHSYRIRKDDFTDALMLNEASFRGQKPLYDALLNPRVEPAGRLNQWGNLFISVGTVGLENMPIINYGRYVHGYLLFLKPLFLFYDLNGIRIINLCVHTLLLLSVLILLCRRLNFKYCLAYFTAFLFLNPEVTWQCLQYATCVNVMLLATLWVLLTKNPFGKYLFFMVGIITAAFDFLTFPLITLGIPLITYICLYEQSLRDNVVCVIKNSLLWGSGYFGVFFCKWILATVVTGENVISEGWQSSLNRINNSEEYVELGQMLKGNLSVLWHVETLYFFLIFLLGLIISYLFKPYKVAISAKSVIVFGIGLMPFWWYVILMNHSAIHHFMTYRILVITIYALLTSVVCCLKPKSA